MASVGSNDFIDAEMLQTIEEEEICSDEIPVEECEIADDPKEGFCTPKKSSVQNEIRVGVVFHDLYEAETCYARYAVMNGFSIKRRTLNKNKSGETNGLNFACCREGTYQRKNPTEEAGRMKRLRASSQRSSCPARMRVKWLRATNEWQVSIFDDKHNHQLVTPSKRHCLKSNKSLPRAVTDVAQRLREQNVPMSKTGGLFGDKDKNTFFNRDIYNHMLKMRKINYEECDAEGVKRYFEKMTAQNPYFYYAIQCDAWGRALNFFWIDGRSRIAYGQFGDVVTFDTTYRTNKYSMPFGPFTGVNHHRQSILFGCALLGNETEETFVWLFQTWLDAVGGKAPGAIITNQDHAMTTAIAKVFSNTRHRYCLWHIKKKFVEKLGHIFFKESKFKRDVKRVTRTCHSIEEFERHWAALVRDYDLEHNSWMQQLYGLRSMWIPVYCRDTFFAGMNTTQRSESINALFNQFVTPRTDLREFVRKYDRRMVGIYVTERQEDYDSIYKSRNLTYRHYLMEHAATVYTKNLFVKFMEEFNASHLLRIEERSVCTYMVQAREVDTYEWIVKFNLVSKEGSCGCKLFEFYGIPCQHLIKVFDRLCLDEIPLYFIKKRWMKDANREQVIAPAGIVMKNKDISSEAARISDVCRRATQLAYIMCKSDLGYEKLCECLGKGMDLAKELDAKLLEKENEMR